MGMCMGMLQVSQIDSELSSTQLYQGCDLPAFVEGVVRGEVVHSRTVEWVQI